MGTTTPSNIYFADKGTQASLEAITATMAQSVQNALDPLITQVRNYRVADSAALEALSGMQDGDLCYVQNQSATYRYFNSQWRILSRSRTEVQGITLSGFITSMGNGTIQAFEAITDGIYSLDVFFTCGTTTTFGSNSVIQVNGTRSNRGTGGGGFAAVTSSSASRFALFPVGTPTPGFETVRAFRMAQPAGTSNMIFTGSATLNSTTPFTWASGSVIRVSVTGHLH